MADYVDNGTTGEDYRVAPGVYSSADRYVSSLYGGNDLFNASFTRYLVYGGDGDDSISGQMGGLARGGDGEDSFSISMINGADPNADDHTVYGDNGADRFSLFFGTGSGQDARLFGGAGADEFLDNSSVGSGGLGGTNAFDGGTGFDMVRAGGSAGVSVSLTSRTGSGGTAANNTYINIEGLYGSTGNDGLEGNGVANVLIGQNGADTLSGLAGDDLLIGSTRGNGFLYEYTGDGGASRFASINPFDNLRNNGVGSKWDDDGAADALFGGNGNDVLMGGAGADSLNGGGGLDWASYADADAAVTASLATGGTGGDALGDTFALVENLFGSRAGDSLTGSGGANDLRGEAGGDSLFGLNGGDTLMGGEGDDRLDGGAGNDLLVGGGGIDRFVFAAVLSAANADRGDDLDTSSDVLVLDDAFFTRFAGSGTVASANLALGARTTTTQYLAYDAGTGALTYDFDGAGIRFAASLVATLDTGLALSAGDFEVV